MVNYDLLTYRLPQLLNRRHQAVVVDESHYAKDPKAQRSRALLTLAEAVDPHGFRLLLTGTPVLNRPVELIHQLRILGRLQDVATPPRAGKRADADWEFSFKFEFCGAAKNDFGKWNFQGASNLALLNERLRASCYVRRERDEVLDLTATTRTDVRLTLNGELSTYRKAEADFIEWLYEAEGASAARNALRAEAITRLGKLRKLVAQAKLDAVVEWVENFQASFPGKSLVLFAHHVEVQHALIERFGCPAILGGQSVEVTEEAKRRFQSGEAKVIVCSLSAAREGHTLTAAHHVVFVEFPWHSGAYDQAADRVNRIGQTEAVTAWNLVVEDTVDERMISIIEAKRATFQALAIGGQFDDAEESSLDALIDSYRKEG